MLKILTAAATAVALLTPSAPAAAAPVPAAVASAPNMQDEAFLIAAHQSHLFEIAGGQIAETRGQTAEVRELGAHFAQSHIVLDRAVTATAARVGVVLPSQPDPAQRRRLAQYSNYDAERFDILYVLTQILGHQAALADGDRETREGADPRVVKLVRDSRPMIAGHHQTLLSLRRTLLP
ncbi:DUF4142 domain-containing protein [Actinoplanes sp. NPDC000266]